jgi:hypothetical protein
MEEQQMMKHTNKKEIKYTPQIIKQAEQSVKQE